jgi:hypothetical protein
VQLHELGWRTKSRRVRLCGEDFWSVFFYYININSYKLLELVGGMIEACPWMDF